MGESLQFGPDADDEERARAEEPDEIEMSAMSTEVAHASGSGRDEEDGIQVWLSLRWEIHY